MDHLLAVAHSWGAPNLKPQTAGLPHRARHPTETLSFPARHLCGDDKPFIGAMDFRSNEAVNYDLLQPLRTSQSESA